MAIFGRIRAVLLWPKAIRQFEDRKFAECLKTLEKIRPYLVGKSSSSLDVEVDTMRIVSLGRLGKPEVVLREIDALLSEIAKLKSTSERRYLEAVVKVVGQYAANEVGPHDAKPAENLRFDWATVDLTGAPERLRCRFPLTGHPEWR